MDSIARVSAPAAGALRQSLEALRKPGGSWALQPHQKRQLIAAVLASMIPCDGRILDVEINRFVSLLREQLGFTSKEIGVALENLNHILTGEELKLAADQMEDMLNVKDRNKLVGLLWDLAMCDNHLHPKEEKLVYELADQMGVLRKHTADLQAQSARNLLKNKSPA